MSSHKYDLAAYLLIIAFAVTVFASSWDDSPSFDEPEHLTSGYAALWAQFFFPNPYHPPLIKDIAAAGAATINPSPPWRCPVWKKLDREALTRCFIFKDNDSQALIRAARAPLILLFSLCLAYYFAVLKRLFSPAQALLALWMMAFSPTIIAHSRFVHTDMAAGFAFFFCISLFADYLPHANKERLTKLALGTAIAQLIKFSLLLLFPIYALTGLWYWLISRKGNAAIEKLKRFPLHLTLVFIASLTLIWLCYAWQTCNLDASIQHLYDQRVFRSTADQFLPRIIFAIDTVPFVRALSWYLSGVTGQLYNVFGEHTSLQYFRGAYSTKGNLLYFPTLFLTKEPSAYLVLELIAAGYWLRQLGLRIKAKDSFVLDDQTKSSFLLSSFLFVYIYFLLSMISPLNLGFRHLIPILPFIYALTASAVVTIWKQLAKKQVQLVFVGIFAMLVLWASVSSALAFPGYLQYFNEIAGGKAGGANIAMDSNFDWGTDCYRLKKYLQLNKIGTVYAAWFNCYTPDDYFGDRGKQLAITRHYPPGSILAISTAAWQHLKHMLITGPTQDWQPITVTVPQPYDASALKWLLSLKPCARVGETILIFRTP